MRKQNTNEYGKFYNYIGGTKSSVYLSLLQDPTKSKQSGKIVTEAEIKDRNNFKRLKDFESKIEQRKFNGLNIPKTKIFEMDRMIKNKLKNEGFEIHYTDFIDPLADIPELDADLSKLEEPSQYVEDIKKMKSTTRRGCSKVKLMYYIAKGIEKKITYEEWLDRKNAEEAYWKKALEIEKQEQAQVELKKLQEAEITLGERQFSQ